MVKPSPTRNPARTKAKILDAGISLFASRGYDGTPVDEIVALAGVNKRMLYHYFDNKDGLYVDVLRAVFAKLEALELRVLDDANDVESAIREFLEQYFEFLIANPEFVSLLMWENLNGGRFLAEHPDVFSKNPVIERLQTLLTKGQREGTVRPTLDPKHLLIVLIGVCFIYHSNRHTLSQTLGLDLLDPTVRETGLAGAQDLVLRGILS